MKTLVFIFILFIFNTSVYALEKLTEPEMKNTTGQLASVAGDIGGAISPASMAAGDFGPLFVPVSPVADIYDFASPHVDPVSDISAASDSAAPVTRIVNVIGDVTVPFGLF